MPQEQNKTRGGKKGDNPKIHFIFGFGCAIVRDGLHFFFRPSEKANLDVSVELHLEMSGKKINNFSELDYLPQRDRCTR